MSKHLNGNILIYVLFCISIYLFFSSHLEFLQIYSLKKNIFDVFQVYAANEEVVNSENQEKNSFVNLSKSTDNITDEDLDKFFNQDDNHFTYNENVISKALLQRYRNILDIEKKTKERELKLDVLTKHFKDQIQIFENVRKEVDAFLQEYKGVYDAEILALVKIYESMKPTEAAQVFSYMDLSLLTKIAMNMKEIKLSAIFGKMQPEKVTYLTNALLEAKKLQGTNINYVCNIVFGL